MTSRSISRLCCINPSPCAPKRTSHQQRTAGILGRCYPRRHCRRYCLPPFRRTPRRFPHQHPFQNCTAGNTQQTGRGNRTGQTGEILHPLLVPQQLYVRQCIRSLHWSHLSGPGLRPLQAVHGREDFQNYIDLDKMSRKEVNFKSKLIEWSQKNKMEVSFELIEQFLDEEYNPMFHTEVRIEGISAGTGTGYSKKESQQNAAQMALKKLRMPLSRRKSRQPKSETIQQKPPQKIIPWQKLLKILTRKISRNRFPSDVLGQLSHCLPSPALTYPQSPPAVQKLFHFPLR